LTLSTRVYTKLLQVPEGKVTTYGDLAKAVGLENGQRAIGTIMKKNPFPGIVPCHRVVKSDGKIGGFVYGERVKSQMLVKEGIKIEIDKLDHMLNNFKVVTDKSNELSTTISELRKSSESFSSLTLKLDIILTKMENGEGTLGKLINNDTLHENMNNLINELRALVKDLKDNPTKYMKAYRKSK